MLSFVYMSFLGQLLTRKQLPRQRSHGSEPYNTTLWEQRAMGGFGFLYAC